MNKIKTFFYSNKGSVKKERKGFLSRKKKGYLKKVNLKRISIKRKKLNYNLIFLM
jgi:hypothetical protein